VLAPFLCRQGRGAPDLPSRAQAAAAAAAAGGCTELLLCVLASFSAGKAEVHLIYPTAGQAVSAAAAAGGFTELLLRVPVHSLQARQRCT
jgi:hypothetical protein